MSATPQQDTAPDNGKAGIGAYISLVFAIIFFSGICASKQWWGVFDFTTLNGNFGTLVSSVTEKADVISTTMANFRGKGGSGAIDGFMFAIGLIPAVMFALAMVTVFEHYGALRAARNLLTPILRPLIGVPGSATLALIASWQSTDGGAALTRQLRDAGELDDVETLNFAAFQLTADATITNFMGSGAVLFTLTVPGSDALAVPTSLGVCLGVMLIGKVFAANVMRLLQIRKSRKAKA